MKRVIIFIVLVGLLSGMIWLLAEIVLGCCTPIRAEAIYTIPRSIQYSYTIQNTTNTVIKDVEFWTYAPVRQTSIQLCDRIESSHPYTIISDAWENQILHFTFDEFPPYATKIVTIKADLLLSDSDNPVRVDDFSPYLASEKYIESNDPEIHTLAKQLHASTPLKTSKNDFSWVSTNLKYSGYTGKDHGALNALRTKKGDCTEYMYLFVALNRANKVPSRCVGGYICNRDEILRPSAYHNWAEFYLDGSWRIADPQNKQFMENHSDYIAMRIFGFSDENPIATFHRFKIKGEGIKVIMNGSN